MAHYIVLSNYTEQGIKAVKDTGKRAKSLRDLAKTMDVTIRDIFWTLGSYDLVLTLEGPNDETVASLMLKLGALGNLKSQTLRAFPESQIEALLAKV